MDKEYIKQFWENRSKLSNMMWNNSIFPYNIKIINGYTNYKSKVLDLGAGDGRISKTIAPTVTHVTAVDYTKRINEIKSKNITTIVDNILNVKLKEGSFDIIILFGVTNYLNDEDVDILYKNCRKWLCEDGILLIKHQCGIENDVLIDKYSPKFEARYVAVYRGESHDKNMLEQAGFTIKVLDPYPKEFNTWGNTIFRLFEAHK